MNKTLWLDTVRLIKKTKQRFILLTLIVAIGVAFFVGVKSSSSIMAYSVNDYYNAYNLMDIQIYSDYGFDDEDIKAVKNVEGVKEVYGNNFLDVFSIRNGSEVVIRVHNLNNNINEVLLVEGRLPEADNECVVEASLIDDLSYKIGDVIKIYRNDDKIDDFLKNYKYKVVGKIRTPYYLNDDKGYSTLNNRYINTFMYIDADNFINDFYIEMAIRLQINDYTYSFSDEYLKERDRVSEVLENLGITQVKHRQKEVLTEANTKYNDGLSEYEDALKTFNQEISDAEEKIAQAKKDIAEGERDITDGYAEVEDSKLKLAQEVIDGQRTINEKRIELGNQEAALEKARSAFESKKAELLANLGQIEAGINTVDGYIAQTQEGINLINTNLVELNHNLHYVNYQLSLLDQSDPLYADLSAQKIYLETTILNLNNQLNELNLTLNGLNTQKNELLDKKNQINAGIAEGEAKLGEAYSQIQYGYQALTNASVELDQAKVDAEMKIEEAIKKLQEAKVDLEEAKLKLKDGLVELEESKADGQQKLDDAKADLDKAKQDIEELQDGKWTVLNRNKHYATRTFSDTLSQMSSIGNIFPIFFFLVAALVCLTTMSRMIDEERGQIGIYRALGYSKRQIYLKYILYSTFAAVFGSVIGNIFGITTIPPVLYEAWKMMYNLPEYKIYIPYDLMLLTGGMFMLVLIVTTYYSCRNEIKEVPALLLRPKAMLKGKKTFLEHIGFIWNNLGFTSKVTARNLIRYKKRFFMSVIGVAGCTALLATGLGIRDSITSVLTGQFEVINQYDGLISVEDDLSVSETNKLFNEIGSFDNVERVTLANFYSSDIVFDNIEKVTNIVVMDKDKINDLFYLKHDGKALSLDDEGIVLSSKLAELLGVKLNEEVEIESFNGVKAKVVVKGICDMHVYHYGILSKEAYQKLFNVNLKDNTVILKAINSKDTKALQEELLALNGVKAINFFDVVFENYSNIVDGLNSVIYVIIISSGILAFVVLSNLTNINISERHREIATLKVLGFTRQEVNKYIYKENMILTLIGSLAGIPLGIMLHRYIIVLVEIEDLMFGRNISISSMIISVVLTLLFSVFVNIYMSGQLKKIKMVESLKSVE